MHMLTMIFVSVLILCAGIGASNPNIAFPADAEPKIPHDVISRQNLSVTIAQKDLPGEVKILKNVALKHQRNIILARGTNHLSVITNVEKPIVIKWAPEKSSISKCMDRGHKRERCQNHILLAEETKKNTLLVCGTNADNPMCRYYNISQETFGKKYVKDVQAQPNDITGIAGLIPSDPSVKYFSHFTDDKILYTAVSGSTPIFKKWFMDRSDRRPIETFPNAFSISGKTEIIGMINRQEKMFVFFTEKNEENLVSRVATICANDQGTHDGSFTTFVKGKIDCPVTKDASFR